MISVKNFCIDNVNYDLHVDPDGDGDKSIFEEAFRRSLADRCSTPTAVVWPEHIEILEVRRGCDEEVDTFEAGSGGRRLWWEGSWEGRALQSEGVSVDFNVRAELGGPGGRSIVEDLSEINTGQGDPLVIELAGEPLILEASGLSISTFVEEAVSADALASRLAAEAYSGVANLLFALDGVWAALVFWTVTRRNGGSNSQGEKWYPPHQEKRWKRCLCGCLLCLVRFGGCLQRFARAVVRCAQWSYSNRYLSQVLPSSETIQVFVLAVYVQLSSLSLGTTCCRRASSATSSSSAAAPARSASRSSPCSTSGSEGRRSR